MEVSLIPQDTIKIKGKHSVVLVNPVLLKNKTTANAVLLLRKHPEFHANNIIESQPLRIEGPGEYEIGGIKITGVKASDGFYYIIHVDSLDILTGTSSSLSQTKDTPKECQIIILMSDSAISQSHLAALDANAIIFYGAHAAENLKSLGKEETTSNKYTFTPDNLPAETQFLSLG